MTEMELLKAIGDLEDTHIAEMYNYVALKAKRRSPRVFLLAAIIAALMLALTVGASGIVRWEDGSWFDTFFSSPSSEVHADAITEHQQELLDSGLVKFGQAVEQDGYTFILDSALCDGHRLMAKFFLEAPEGTVLEKGRYDVILDYRAVYPDGSRIPLGAMSGSFGQLEDPDPTDGRLQFLLDVLLQPSPDADVAMLVGACWEIKITEFQYAFSREEEYWFEPLATGEWSFVIPFDESSLLTREEEVLEKPVWVDAVRYWDDRADRTLPVNVRVTSLRLRALSATLSYDRPLTGFWRGIDMGDIYIIMKDGTKILAHWDMGHNKGKYWQDTLTFPVPVAWEDVAFVLLPNGDKIPIEH